MLLVCTFPINRFYNTVCCKKEVCVNLDVNLSLPPQKDSRTPHARTEEKKKRLKT